MKTILTIALSCLLCITVLAQQPDKVLARVKYNFTHLRDTNQRNNPYTETMLLVIGKNASVYTSLDQLERDLDLPKARKAPSAPFKPTNLTNLYFFAKETKLVTREKFMSTYYLVEEQYEKMNWKMTKDTLNVNGIHCKKALATFKGRNWIAWYAPELPFQSGPWKLSGLPGLIIQAYDDQKEVMFEFAGIDNLKKENLSEEQLALEKAYEKTFFYRPEIALQKDAKPTSRVEFDKIMELYRKDPIGYISAESGMPRNRIFMGTSTTGVSHNITNNPIELPKNNTPIK